MKWTIRFRRDIYHLQNTIENLKIFMKNPEGGRKPRKLGVSRHNRESWKVCRKRRTMTRMRTRTRRRTSKANGHSTWVEHLPESGGPTWQTLHVSLSHHTLRCPIAPANNQITKNDGATLACKGEETGVPRENQASGIVQHDSHMRKSGSEPGSPWWEASVLATHHPIFKLAHLDTYNRLGHTAVDRATSRPHGIDLCHHPGRHESAKTSCTNEGTALTGATNTNLNENTIANLCMSTYKLDCVHYISAQGFDFDAMLCITGVMLEFLMDYDMHIFVENGIRGGVPSASNYKRPRPQCTACGKKHLWGKFPVYHKQYHKCDKYNHFRYMCSNSQKRGEVVYAEDGTFRIESLLTHHENLEWWEQAYFDTNPRAVAESMHFLAPWDRLRQRPTRYIWLSDGKKGSTHLATDVCDYDDAEAELSDRASEGIREEVSTSGNDSTFLCNHTAGTMYGRGRKWSRCTGGSHIDTAYKPLDRMCSITITKSGYAFATLAWALALPTSWCRVVEADVKDVRNELRFAHLGNPLSRHSMLSADEYSPMVEGSICCAAAAVGVAVLWVAAAAELRMHDHKQCTWHTKRCGRASSGGVVKTDVPPQTRRCCFCWANDVGDVD
ncbi:hypothetical protein PR048_001796 [Dryococelus australis]|uniref:Uncharacterized protein n=1 Tax=Dryococelus australis TaxID=614101 RepID=A0ABQ9IJ26_9NEOP|nr:hypothetical protein PR048_001796 [Dryococelus australis]